MDEFSEKECKVIINTIQTMRPKHQCIVYWHPLNTKYNKDKLIESRFVQQLKSQGVKISIEDDLMKFDLTR